MDAISEEATVEIDVAKACENGLTLDEYRTICSDPTLNKKYYKSCRFLWALYLELPVDVKQLKDCSPSYSTFCGCGYVEIACTNPYYGWGFFFEATTGKLVGISEGEDVASPEHLCGGYYMDAGELPQCGCKGMWDGKTCSELSGGGCEAGVDAPADAADAPDASEPADAEPDVTDASSSP